ncbi:hypothetical protein C8J57DRAFT_1531856 [Mycena rebaudengoi]|nr:hypothetical protein C8J57DRAFT_1531856 [Mycena rebaudengoi]
MPRPHMDIHFGHYATSDGLPQKHDGEEQGFAPGSTQRLKFTQKIRPASSAANVLVKECVGCDELLFAFESCRAVLASLCGPSLIVKLVRRYSWIARSIHRL